MPDETPIRLRLDICYDGTAFSGWAVQPGRRTVAGVIAAALRTVLRADVPMVVAGRTDAGVHAVGQVAHVDVPFSTLCGLAPRRLPGGIEPLEAGMTGLRRRLAGLLPPDVRVLAVRRASEGFDARFAALRRHYRYRIFCSDWGLPPGNRWDVLHWRRPLDAAAMQRAAGQLVGLHDFAAYCKPREGATTIRDLQLLTVENVAPGGQHLSGLLASGVHYPGDVHVSGAEHPGALVHIDVSADAFCHSMVRSLVGALIAVGEGRSGEDRPAILLRARTRTAEIAVAPARGLTLMRVDYPAEADLAARSEVTRAVRSVDTGCDCAE